MRKTGYLLAAAFVATGALAGCTKKSENPLSPSVAGPIAGVSITYDERGEMTRLRVTGKEAFDLQPVGDRRSQKKSGKSKGGSKPGGLDGTAKPL